MDYLSFYASVGDICSNIITRLICETPTLSDKKVEAITKMISKDFKFFK